MKFISISIRTAKQMRKIMYNRLQFILHKKLNPHKLHDVKEKVFQICAVFENLSDYNCAIFRITTARNFMYPIINVTGFI